MESFGEDPYVNGIMGKAMVDGYQQKADTRIAAVSYTHLDKLIKNKGVGKIYSVII